MKGPLDIPGKAFGDALRFSPPTAENVAALLVAGDLHNAAAVAHELASTDPEPLLAVAVATLQIDGGFAAKRCLEVVQQVLSNTELHPVVANATMALTSFINAPAAESAYDSSQPVVHIAATSRPLTLEVVTNLDNALPTLAAWAISRTADPIAHLRNNEAFSGRVRAVAELFHSGRPELALLGVASAPTDALEVCMWWLAALQCGVLERDLPVIEHVANAIDATLTDALIADAESCLGFRSEPDVADLPAAYRTRIHQRRGPDAALAYTIWKSAATVADGLAERPVAGALDIARAALQRSDVDDAIAALIDVVEIISSPAERAEFLVLAGSIARAGRSDDAAAHTTALFEEAVAADPTSVSAMAALTDWYHATQHPQMRESEQALRALLQSTPQTAETVEHVERAADVIARIAGRNQAGTAALEQATERHPKCTHRWIALANFHARLQQWPQSAASLEEAARSEYDARERAGLYRQVGDVYRDLLNERQPALEHYMVSFVCWPGSEHTLDRLETLYADLNRKAELASLYELAIAHAEDYPHDAEFTVPTLRARCAEHSRS